jgi:hypothetical protein
MGLNTYGRGNPGPERSPFCPKGPIFPENSEKKIKKPRSGVDKKQGSMLQ